MVTTVSTKPAGSVSTGTKSIHLGGTGRRAGGNGSRGGGAQPPNGGGGNGGGRAYPDTTPQQYRIGMWLALSAILMMFAALSSAYVFRSTRMQQSWQAFSVPAMLWVSTALILASSASFEVARRALRRGAGDVYRRWLVVSLGLGFGFLVAQLLAWRGLVGQGIYLATNPHSSFFYLLTGLHALHLVGGIAGLIYLMLRARRDAADARTNASGASGAAVKARAHADAIGLYWHFMDGLWVYLFALLFLWR
ncbi:MAG TPA: cytochrome c oxidase subunit 3 [Pyrinomonadaceae bacterium]|nr:cytochrome c oxidase subunit 3 [Pyrinomonadaceae bacterium]